MEIYLRGGAGSVFVYYLEEVENGGTRRQNPLHPWDIAS